MDGQELEFSSGFTELHTEVYRDILRGGGYGLADARPAVELVHRLRQQPIVTPSGLSHPSLAHTRVEDPGALASWPPPAARK
jgi:UDP-N-acetyl-2-amino-2-deoxyglucuronate dehydrogenase